ncbi:hypothetical protein MA16_Dca026471 [Dendrobium catenatum]|uniref:Uncharacterized protein n=1 Tax=Dendrobium catenatum TaxID=906689 RepID=A0A2I0VI17_9ASPA|nr:hypothetical protein MA16_Dca026471 [Dendrobium catenatum]
MDQYLEAIESVVDENQPGNLEVQIPTNSWVPSKGNSTDPIQNELYKLQMKIHLCTKSENSKLSHQFGSSNPVSISGSFSGGLFGFCMGGLAFGMLATWVLGWPNLFSWDVLCFCQNNQVAGKQESHLSIPWIPEDNHPTSKWVPPRTYSSNSLQIKLLMIQRQLQLCAERFESKKLQLQSEFEREKEIIERKYDILTQESEIPYLQNFEDISSGDEIFQPGEI